MRQDVEACNERGGLAMTAVALSADMQRRVLDRGKFALALGAIGYELASAVLASFAQPDAGGAVSPRRGPNAVNPPAGAFAAPIPQYVRPCTRKAVAWHRQR